MSTTGGINLKPAGFSDSDDDYEDEYGKFSFGEDLDKKRNDNKRPLHFAYEKSEQELREERLLNYIKTGQLDAVDEFCSSSDCQNFDFNSPLADSWTPLMYACKHSYYDIVDVLIAHGADVNRTVNGITPLMTACMASPGLPDVLKIVKLLLYKGAVINVSDIMGRTPVMYAAEFKHADIVKLFIEKASLEAVDNEGNTVLFIAIEKKQYEIVRELLNAGANVDIMNNFGFTPKAWAEENNLENIDQYFQAIETEYQVPPVFMRTNGVSDLAPTVFGSADVPAFFGNVHSMLQGMNCITLIPEFAKARVNLFEFLTLTDSRLEDLGITFPVLRHRILLGIMNFHSHPWAPRSIPTMSMHTMVELFSLLAGDLKQLLILQTSISYVMGNEYDPKHSKVNYVGEMVDILNEMSNRLARLRRFVEKIEQLTPNPPLLIQAPEPNKRKLKVYLKPAMAVTMVLASTAVIYKFYKGKIL